MELVGYFWERADADEVAAHLGGVVRRERFHGEDDDEDHPWTVVLPADVDRAAAEEVVTAHDGWLDEHAATAREEPTAAPLPEAPRRFKNPPA